MLHILSIINSLKIKIINWNSKLKFYIKNLTSSWALNEPVECKGFGCKGRLNTDDGWTITLQPLTNE